MTMLWVYTNILILNSVQVVLGMKEIYTLIRLNLYFLYVAIPPAMIQIRHHFHNLGVYPKDSKLLLTMIEIMMNCNILIDCIDSI